MFNRDNGRSPDCVLNSNSTIPGRGRGSGQRHGRYLQIDTSRRAEHMDATSVSSIHGHLAENLAPIGCLVHVLGMIVQRSQACGVRSSLFKSLILDRPATFPQFVFLSIKWKW